MRAGDLVHCMQRDLHLHRELLEVACSYLCVCARARARARACACACACARVCARVHRAPCGMEESSSNSPQPPCGGLERLCAVRAVSVPPRCVPPMWHYRECGVPVFVRHAPACHTDPLKCFRSMSCTASQQHIARGVHIGSLSPSPSRAPDGAPHCSRVAPSGTQGDGHGALNCACLGAGCDRRAECARTRARGGVCGSVCLCEYAWTRVHWIHHCFITASCGSTIGAHRPYIGYCASCAAGLRLACAHIYLSAECRS
jgi:hypothetical protein